MRLTSDDLITFLTDGANDPDETPRVFLCRHLLHLFELPCNYELIKPDDVCNDVFVLEEIGFSVARLFDWDMKRRTSE